MWIDATSANLLLVSCSQTLATLFEGKTARSHSGANAGLGLTRLVIAIPLYFAPCGSSTLMKGMAAPTPVILRRYQC